jgi:predicted RNA binding protein YcfA (HicA-like mRNA interferase family)
MASLPVVSGDEVCRALTRAGFFHRSQKGQSRQDETPGQPQRRRAAAQELALGTLRSILKQAGLSDDEFRALL